MTTILLVDKDTQAVSTLAEELALISPHWQLICAESGQAALEILRQDSIDCVIAEANLPDMSSFELFNRVQQLHTQVIRISTSDNPQEEVVLENARANHRFIAKSAPANVFAAGIESSLHLRIVLQDDDLRARMACIHSLPSLPNIYSEMLGELSTPHSSLINVGRIVERDSGLTATILKVVNSTFYGLSQRVDSVSQAVGLLGVHLIKNLALTASVFSVFEEHTGNTYRLRQLNEDACSVGALSNQFARYAKVARSTVDQSQIAGMLGNVGDLIHLASPGLREISAINLPNEMLGAWLLRDWMMPDPVVEAVALQYEAPPRHHKVITPLTILHAVRYLQENLSRADTHNLEQQHRCHDYLSEYIDADIALLWIDAFRDMQELTSMSNQFSDKVA